MKCLRGDSYYNKMLKENLTDIMYYLVDIVGVIYSCAFESNYNVN